MTQNTAEPAPATQKMGKDKTPTAEYCCAKLNSRPTTESDMFCSGIDTAMKLHAENINNALSSLCI